MLQTLYIENIAVIEKTSIDFNTGLNVLTGETGAGKSIVIDSINAVMGQRVSKEIIRTGEQSAFVSAQFTNINDFVRAKLENLGFSDEDGEVIIQRTINASGKNVCKINGKPASVAMLRQIGDCLVNIHGQHESYELFLPETHIDYIDSFGSCEKILEEYKNQYDILKQIGKKLKKADVDEGERLREIDLLSFQSEELVNADIQQGEQESLENERTALMSFEKINLLLNNAKMLLDGDENTDGGLQSVDSAAVSLQKAAGYNEEYSALSDNITDIYYNLRDCADSVNDAINSLESDPMRLEEIEERLDLLNRLSRKYNCDCDELPQLAEKMQNQLSELLNYDKNFEELKAQYDIAYKNALAKAMQLSEKRKSAAKTFADKVKAEMSFLNMPNVELVPSFEKCNLYEKGIDKVELLISANPGETPRPVAKIASGGELSRMMLAIKTVLSDSDSVDTLIFDEVDTGISGSASQKVGLKLKEVAQKAQVLCVTHQSQIASLADYHYLISKKVNNGRTYTDVSMLDRNGRIYELARINGGVNITKADLVHAESMLDENNIK